MSISEQMAAMRRHRFLLIALPVVAAFVGYVVSASSAKKYAADATVLLRMNDPAENLQGTNNQGDVGQNLSASDYVETQIGVITSRRVLATAAAELGTVDAAEIEEAVTANRVGTTTLVKVVAVSEDPERATQITNAVVEAYAADRRDAAIGGIERALTEVRTKLTALRDELKALSGEAGDSAMSEAEVKAAEAQFAELFRQEQELEINRDLKRGGIEVVSTAETPDEPIAPQPVRNAVTLGLLGAIVAVGLALLRDRMDTSIRSSEDVSALTSAPVLGSLPSDEQLLGSDDVALLKAPFAQFSEAIRGVRTSLQFLGLTNPAQVMVVTGSVPSEGKSTISTNLAASIAQSGESVLLICADLRKSGAERFFGVDRHSEGLSDLVVRAHILRHRERGAADAIASELDRLTVITQCEGLALLPPGTVPPNPNELLGSETFAALIEQARRKYDRVVIDTPPIAYVSDALVAARAADGVVLVTAAGTVERNRVRASLAQIEVAGLHLIGVIANRVQSHAVSYYAYGQEADQGRQWKLPRRGRTSRGSESGATAQAPHRPGREPALEPAPKHTDRPGGSGARSVIESGPDDSDPPGLVTPRVASADRRPTPKRSKPTPNTDRADGGPAPRSTPRPPARNRGERQDAPQVG